jgi:hypothetical protein
MAEVSTANSWPQFLKLVREGRKSLGNPNPVWYRGHPRAEYTLIPSLMRYPKGAKKEQDLFNEYQRWSAILHKDRTSDWDVLFDMQHYGIPTRLLDWTDVLGVSLAFALFDSTNDADPCAIYLLNPVHLNDLSGPPEVKRPAQDQSFSYKSIYWRGQPIKPTFPVAIDAVMRNVRIAAQNGAFTVHGSDARPLEEQAPDCVRKIILQPGAKVEAREFLEHANLNPYSIFPDPVGMAQHLRRKYFSPAPDTTGVKP